MKKIAQKAKKASGAVHFHIWDLPKAIFPRKKGNNAKAYAKDVARLYQSISYANRKLQHTASVAIFCIKSAGQKKKGYMPRPDEVHGVVEEFVYHYENYCERIYVLREKLIHLLNDILPIGFKDEEVNIKQILMQPVLKTSGLLKDLEKFKSPSVLGETVKDRNTLTQKLYYVAVDHYLHPKSGSGTTVTKEWFKDWRKQIENRSARATKGMHAITELNHSLSEKIVQYRRSI